MKIHITFDGGARGNPGLAGAGASVILAEVTKTKEAKDAYRRCIYIREYLGLHSTNNEAEYQGIIRALLIAKREAMQYCPPPSTLRTKILIQGDSDLIIKQLNQQYKCKSPNLTRLYQKVLDLLVDFEKMGNCTKLCEHIYRKDNAIADGTYLPVLFCYAGFVV